MAGKSEALAKQFEAKAAEATKVIEGISDADWTKVTSAEKWSVGVVAHHIAMGHQGIAGIVKTVADGNATAPAKMTIDALHQMNAQHAKDSAGCTKPETVSLLKQNAASAAATVRGLSDEQLARSGNVLSGMPSMTTEQVVQSILINHIDEHLGSIRATLGR